MKSKLELTRRHFIRSGAAAVVAGPLAAAPSNNSHQATGARVGEVTDTTAIVWVRLTKHATRNQTGVPFAKGDGKATKGGRENPKIVPPAHEIEGACPAMAGRVRVRYSLQADLGGALETPWVDVNGDSDGIHQFKLASLKPGSTYHYVTETAGPDGAAHDEVPRQVSHGTGGGHARGPAVLRHDLPGLSGSRSCGRAPDLSVDAGAGAEVCRDDR